MDLWKSPFIFFSDPILRAPTLGCMLMCLAAGLVGAVVFLRKQSLLGEALSHAAYPGVILGVLGAGLLSIREADGFYISLFILIGAFITGLAGLWVIHFLERKMKVKSDAALCFVLSSFFGLGLTLASEVQFSYTTLYKQVQVYLYGQAATMTDIHIWIYGILSLIIASVLAVFYKELQVMIFDRSFAKSIGIQTRHIDTLLFILIVLAVMVGIRSVGVVLMSAMLIAPPVAARQMTNNFSIMLLLSGFIGLLSGFLGNYLSVELTTFLQSYFPQTRIALPTGPMIVLVATAICLVALFFAPQRGLLLRLVRIARFRHQCICENILKTMWRIGPKERQTFKEITAYQSASRWHLRLIMHQMAYNGWIKEEKDSTYRLTADGEYRAAKIVRLHRLWEVYLVDYLGVGAERVHRNAEEMEHIITPELEKELTLLLRDPQRDPHHQPIPSPEVP